MTHRPRATLAVAAVLVVALAGYSFATHTPATPATDTSIALRPGPRYLPRPHRSPRHPPRPRLTPRATDPHVTKPPSSPPSAGPVATRNIW